MRRAFALLMATAFSSLTLPLSGPIKAIRAQDLKTYTLPDDEGDTHWAGRDSYSHDFEGKLIPGSKAGNVVITSTGRIYSVTLDSDPFEGGALDRIGVYVRKPNADSSNGSTMKLNDSQAHTIIDHDDVKLFKCRLMDNSVGEAVIAVWGDPDRLDETTKDSFSIRVNDLYRWRAEKARLGGKVVKLGPKVYRGIPVSGSEGQSGWAYFVQDDLLSNMGSIKPRYVVHNKRMVDGESVKVKGRIPIGDSGFYLVYNRKTDDFDLRDGNDLAIGGPDKPDEIPEIPSVPSLDSNSNGKY
jgi:hypothetical protein